MSTYFPEHYCYLSLCWRVEECPTPKDDYRNSEHAIPEYVTLIYWLYWAVGTRKTENAKGAFLWIPLICLKTVPTKGTQLPQILSLGVSPIREDWLLTGEQSRSLYHSQSTFATNIMSPTYSIKAHLPFLKITYSPPKGLHLLFFLPINWYLSLNSKASQVSQVYVWSTC